MPLNNERRIQKKKEKKQKAEVKNKLKDSQNKR